MLDRPIKTPCIGVCSTGIGDSVCRGCKRFGHEVIDWNGYTLAQKQAVDSRLSGFLSQCVRNTLRVTDKALLQWQLDLQLISYAQHHDEYCWAFSLLKAGAQQIESTTDFGFEIVAPYHLQPLHELRDKIDQEFYTLSEAHYQRYMATPDLFGQGQ
jgi:predicted Fe-S protein YdhL (DUF1289 family)